MKIAEIVCNLLNKQIETLEAEKVEVQLEKKEAISQGDLSENNDFDIATKRLGEIDELLKEYYSLKDLEEETVKTHIDGNIVDIGLLFFVKQVFIGRTMSQEEEKNCSFFKSDLRSIHYDEVNNETIVSSFLMIGGETDLFVLRNIISSKCKLANLLLSKQISDVSDIIVNPDINGVTSVEYRKITKEEWEKIHENF